MAETEISIIVGGEAEYIVAQDFLAALQNHIEVLGDLDAAISMRRRGTLQWVLGALSYGSPATATLRALPLFEERDYGPEVARAYMDGLQQLLEGKELPPAFSDDALDAIKKLARLSTNGVKAIEVKHGQQVVSLTERIAVNIDDLVGGGYEAIGSIEGTLEMVTLHDQSYFRIYDAIHGMGVPCYFHRELLETVRLGLGKRVFVTGRLRSDRGGKPRSLRVEDIRLPPDTEKLPSPSDLRGLAKGMTEGKLAEDYLRDLRDDDGGDR